MTGLERYLLEVEERLRKAESDPSLISRIPMWITAGDGRQWMYEVRTDIPRLLEIIRVQQVSLNFIASVNAMDYEYRKEASGAIDKCDGIAKGEK